MKKKRIFLGIVLVLMVLLFAGIFKVTKLRNPVSTSTEFYLNEEVAFVNVENPSENVSLPLISNNTSVDNKLVFQQLFQSTTDTIKIPEGVYTTSKIDGTIKNKTIKGVQGKTVIRSSEDIVLQLWNSNDVVFEDITFESLDMSESLYGVITVLNSNVKNIKFIRCTFKSKSSNGLKFVNELPNVKSELITFDQCKFVDIGRMGVEFQNHTDDGVLRYSNITFIECEFTNIGTNGDGSGMGISMSGLGDLVSVLNSKFTDCFVAGIELVGATYANLHGNNFVGKSEIYYSPISITNVRPNNNITITNNKSYGTLGSILIYNANELIFSNNTFNGINEVYVKNTYSSKFINNIVNSEGNYALMLDNSGYNEIIGNTLVTKDLNWSALRLFGNNSNNNIINGNKLYIGNSGVFFSEIEGAANNDIGDNY